MRSKTSQIQKNLIISSMTTFYDICVDQAQVAAKHEGLEHETRHINVLSRAQVLHVLQQLGLDQHCEQCTQQAKF